MKLSAKILSLCMVLMMVLGALSIFTLFPTPAHAAESVKYTFSNYAEGTQYATNEVHKLDDVVTITTTQAHFTTQLRLYSSSTHDGFAIIQSTKPITSIVFNMGYKVDTLNVYGSTDSTTWTLITGVKTTATSYKDYTANLGDGYKYLKLDVKGAEQIRIASMTLTFADDAGTECPHTDTVEIGEAKDATCTKDGITAGEKCADCGHTITEQEKIPATGVHTYSNGVCTGCGASDGTGDDTPSTESGWILTDIADIKPTDIVVIVWSKGGQSWAVSNDKGTSGSPDAVGVTIEGNKLSGDIKDTIKWNITNSNGSLTIYPNGTTATWLYCTNSNTGVRVGTNTNKTFTIDATSGYLKHTGTSRFVGVYTTKPDVRCYTDYTVNIGDQTLAFYVLNEGNSSSEPECEHNYTTEVTAPTCTTGGYTTHTCTKEGCGHSYTDNEEPALGHSYGSGVETEPTCTEGGYTTYTCSCGDTYIGDKVAPTGHNWQGGNCITPPTCSVCQAQKETKTGWQLVKDVNDLKAGDVIIIVVKDDDYTYALSTTQNPNNRGAATITKDGDTVTFGDDVQIITLQAGTVNGTFAFYTGSGYLYAASSGSNYLRTQDEIDANASWTIEIDSEGVATVIAQGTNTRNILRFNPNTANSNPLFSCYGSGQQDIAIYKYFEDEALGHDWENGYCTVCENECKHAWENGKCTECDVEAKFSAASVTLNTSLAVNFKVLKTVWDSLDGAEAVFTFGGRVFELSLADKASEDDEYYVFSITNIGPHQMKDTISYKLVWNGGEQLPGEYSIAEYCYYKLYDDPNGDAEGEFRQLLVSLLNYGAAAQTYKDYNTENLANAKLEESDKVTSEYDFSEQDCKQEGKSNGVTWSGAYLYLIDTAELRFAFTVGEGVDVSKLTVVFTWKGGEHKYTSDKFVTVGNKYYVYFDMVAATDMKEPVKVKVMQGDDVQLSTTLTYSVYSYGWQVNEANKKDGSMENELALVKSLLVYGDAAYAYAQAKNQD